MTTTRKDKLGKQQPIVLDFRNVTTAVVVRPDEKDRFVTTVAEAARACQFAEQALQWQQEFGEFLRFVHDWSNQHAKAIRRTYVSPAPHGLEVFIVTAGDHYRFDLDDEVSRLDLDLVTRFSRCPAHVMHVPDESPDALESFFSPERALQVYGK